MVGEKINVNVILAEKSHLEEREGNSKGILWRWVMRTGGG
jgi:hypothetical protein